MNKHTTLYNSISSRVDRWDTMFLLIVFMTFFWTAILSAWIPQLFAFLSIALILIIIPVFSHHLTFKHQWKMNRLISVISVTISLFFLFSIVAFTYFRNHFSQSSLKLDLVVGLLDYLHFSSIQFVLLIVIAIGEELFWRGYVQTKISNSIGDRRGLLATSLLYGLMFIPTNEPLLFAMATVSSLYWGWIYAHTKTIWVTLISHPVWIGLTLAVLPQTNHASERYVDIIRILHLC